MASSHLGFFRSDMNRFMETNFTERIEQEQHQMIDEAALASRLQPKQSWIGSADEPLELDNAIDLDIEVDTGNWPAERGVTEEGALPAYAPRPPTVGSGVHDLPIDHGEEETMDDMPTATVDATDLAGKMRDEEQEETRPRRTLRAIPACDPKLRRRTDGANQAHVRQAGSKPLHRPHPKGHAGGPA